jgi:hypothetical protein
LKQEDDMSALSVLILVAVAGAMFSLAAGITAMAHDSVVAHNDSVHWMMWRVAFQAVAMGLIVLMLGVGFR